MDSKILPVNNSKASQQSIIFFHFMENKYKRPKQNSIIKIHFQSLDTDSSCASMYKIRRRAIWPLQPLISCSVHAYGIEPTFMQLVNQTHAVY